MSANKKTKQLTNHVLHKPQVEATSALSQPGPRADKLQLQGPQFSAQIDPLQLQPFVTKHAGHARTQELSAQR